jgi:hypothetical protein
LREEINGKTHLAQIVKDQNSLLSAGRTIDGNIKGISDYIICDTSSGETHYLWGVSHTHKGKPNCKTCNEVTE